MQIACLHTAEVHVETFAALFAAQAPGVDVSHVVRADLLARAQSKGAGRVADATAEAVADLADFDAVLCTCSTLGPLVDALHDTRLIRIDRPLMAAAAAHGARPLLAICLESTRAASLALLKQAGGPDMAPTVLSCADAWPHFEAADMDTFAAEIARTIKAHIAGHDCVVLGQASMRVAEPLLAGLDIPVLSSPALAVAATMAVAS